MAAWSGALGSPPPPPPPPPGTSPRGSATGLVQGLTPARPSARVLNRAVLWAVLPSRRAVPPDPRLPAHGVRRPVLLPPGHRPQSPREVRLSDHLRPCLPRPAHWLPRAGLVARRGRASLVPWTLIVVNVLSLGALGLVGGGLAHESERHAFAGLLLPGFWGCPFSLARDTAEIVAAAFAMSALLALRRGRPWWAAVLLSAGVLTRRRRRQEPRCALSCCRGCSPAPCGCV